MLQSIGQGPVGLSFKDEHTELDDRAEEQHKHIDTDTETLRYAHTHNWCSIFNGNPYKLFNVPIFCFPT